MAPSSSSKLVSDPPVVARPTDRSATQAKAPERAKTEVTDPQTQSQAAAPSLLARGSRFLWPALCFLQLGLLIGGYLLYERTRTHVEAKPPETRLASEH